MSALPLTNATVTAVAGGGATEDYDASAGADTARWSGGEGAYVAEELVTELAAGKADEVSVTRLTIADAVGKLARRGDTVTYEFDGAVVSRTVREVQRYRAVGTARLTFEST